MNILLLSDHFLPNIGGGEFITHYWAEALTKRGHHVVVPAFKPMFRKYKESMKFPYTVHRSTFIPYAELFSRICQFRQIHRRKPIDIIHANFLYYAGHVGIKLQNLFNVPCVVSGQGTDILVYEPLQYGNLLNPTILKKTIKVIRHSSGLIYNCQKVKERMLELGAAEHKLYYVVNGTSYDNIKSDKRLELRQQLGIHPDDLVFIAISRNSPIKGLDLLIDAVQSIGRHSRTFKVLLIGPGTHKLQQKIDERGLTKFFQVIGELPFFIDPETQIPQMPSQNVIDYLCASDVYMAPALSGTFELSTADAMSAGLAVIVSDNIGNKDVVQSGVNGYVTQNNNAQSIAGAMCSLLDQPALVRTMGNINIELAKKYDWGVIAENLESIYTDIMNQYHKKNK